MRGRFSEARDLVPQAQVRCEELGFGADSYLYLRSIVEMFAGAPEIAEEALRIACANLQREEQTARLATRAAELADSIYEQARYDEAETWIRLARESAGSDDLDAAFLWRHVAAKVFAAQGAVDEAEQLAREAIDLVARTDALNRHADSLLSLGVIHRLASRESEALESIRKALRLYEQKGNIVSAERTRSMLLEGAIPE
jgi:tetratricopeptide (TPR) repeat protein